MGILDGKIAIITGGAGSIGYASARLFVQEGARVMLVDRDASKLEQIVGELGKDRAAFQVADVGDASATKVYLAAARSRWGAIDVLFSNAGNTGDIAPLANYSEQVFDEVYRVHVKGAFLACKYGLGEMNEGGSIIITSSVAGLRGTPGFYGYVTAKHAQIGLMRSVAKEAAGRRIRVNALLPGPVDNGFQTSIENNFSGFIQKNATELVNGMIALGRHAQPLEIAHSALYLASDHSTFTTGSTLVVDGGMDA
jgi:NAD(P)-dependent dehydrogenase (short-subunit alcohol dehydrogenase family)